MNILFPYLARWNAVNFTRYHSLLAALAAKGHQVHVLEPPGLDLGETNFHEVEPRLIENIRVSEVKINGRFWTRRIPLEKIIKKTYYAQVARRRAERIISEEGIDVVLLYNIPHYSFLGLRNCLKVFDYADDYEDMLVQELRLPGNRLFSPFLRWFAGWLVLRMTQKADVTFAVSKELKKRLPEHAIVLPNGVSKSKLLCGASGGRTKEKSEFTVGYVGAFEYFIDFDVILDSARRLPDVQFLLVGGGRDHKTVVERAVEKGISNIVFTGGVPHPEVFRHIDQMDVCLNMFRPIPVSHNACPIKVFEYFSRGKPVISTRLKEILNLDDGSILFADSADELVEKIEWVRRHPREAAELGRRGRDFVQQKYTWEMIAEQFEREVEKHIQGTPVP